VVTNDTITVDVNALTMRFGLYCNLDGSSSVTGNTITDLIKQYMAGVTDRLTAEGR
jgi:putative cofactor-binding repeat protein